MLVHPHLESFLGRIVDLPPLLEEFSTLKGEGNTCSPSPGGREIEGGVK